MKRQRDEYVTLTLNDIPITIWKQTEYLNLTDHNLKYFPDLTGLNNIKYLNINPNVQWNTDMYPYLSNDDKERILTILLIHKYGPLNVFPIEIIHNIINDLSLRVIKDERDKKCLICGQEYICIDHSVSKPIDNELCKYVESTTCTDTFHQCCINRWLKFRSRCPICTVSWISK